MEKRNRDWNAHWSQANGRSQYDYGRSGPIVGMYEPGGFWRWFGYACGSLVMSLVFIAWIV